MKHKYTLHEVSQAVNKSTSIRQALIHLGVRPMGGNYRVLTRLCDKYKIDLSHFTGKSQSVGRRQIKTPTKAYLTNKQPINSYRLKDRLLKEGIKLPICENCSGTEWLGNPIPLELDHINGNSNDNRLTNLKILCPNCHALTPTYRGRNKK